MSHDVRGAPAGNDAPIFILCHARSGSTLLRILLDSHDAVASPPESHLAAVCQNLELTWRKVTLPGGLGELPRHVMAEIRDVASRPMQTYARARGKRIWCEKSLDSVGAAPLLAKVFPDARFVCLYRHCLDVVMSGLEAGVWGFAGYGFEQYVRDSPGNTVRALVRYWCDHTEALLAVRPQPPASVTAVRYEDLVTDTEATLQRLQADLDLPPCADLATVAFHRSHDLGSGDHKLPFTERVSSRSIGTGRRIPVTSIPRDLRTRMNDCLVALGYAPVDDDWNRRPAAAVTVGAQRGAVGLGRILADPTVAVDACRHDPSSAADRVLVVLEDLRLQWSLDLTTATLAACERMCPTGGRLTTDSATLAQLVADELNVGSALRSGVLRASGRTSTVADTVTMLRRMCVPDRPAPGLAVSERPGSERPGSERPGSERPGSERPVSGRLVPGLPGARRGRTDDGAGEQR